EVWISEEIITFVSLYYEDGVETRFNCGSRLHDQVRDESLGISKFPSIGRHVGGEHPYKLNDMEWLQAHRHVLIGANEVSPFLYSKQSQNIDYEEDQQLKLKKLYIETLCNGLGVV
ncbi:hypothetical protein LINPERPRIM_LOCUS38215, partial [Linum perenne]